MFIKSLATGHYILATSLNKAQIKNTHDTQFYLTNNTKTAVKRNGEVGETVLPCDAGSTTLLRSYESVFLHKQ
jgi:hypothetical protein